MTPATATTTEASAAVPAVDDDEQLAKDLQLALSLQDKEELLVARVQMQQAKADKRRARHNRHIENQGFCTPANMRGMADHMLFVLCELDDRVVEMLVDSGASTSAISSTMMERLSLQHKMSPHVAGQASGVGSARILGALENICCSIGQVEFRLFFMVLESPVPFLILGLDQMRRFKCVIDLDSNSLRFGGADGVSAPFMDKELSTDAAAKTFMAASNSNTQAQAQAFAQAHTRGKPVKQPKARQDGARHDKQQSKSGATSKLGSLFGMKKKSKQ
eukprot:CAMPEP_0198120338 /NCGR_PEP_ID=MMETSP1442-20131203/28698_1 /TAXON_ID= /ORGANISM="Craspedostauros australis, Strain CCMP3328" /LENGTH=275 /DNA_ID=CAMNT_0043778975 /DNA_START=96 /DNA_END=923 /DNA_ORIENTATION=-